MVLRVLVCHLVSGSIQLRGEGKEVVMRRGGMVGVKLGRQGYVEGDLPGFQDADLASGQWKVSGRVVIKNR